MYATIYKQAIFIAYDKAFSLIYTKDVFFLGIIIDFVFRPYDDCILLSGFTDISIYSSTLS